MRFVMKSGFAAAAAFAASLVCASLTHAAPLTGMTQAAPALQSAKQPLVVEALPEKVHHRVYTHHPRYRHHHHGYGHHHHGYGHHPHGY